MEAIAQLDENFPWIVPVEPSEGLAVIEIHPAIGHIRGVQRCGEPVAEILAKRKIEGRVLRQMVSRIRRPRKGIAETGAIVNIGGSSGFPWKNDFTAEVESIALVVIESK